MATQKIRVAYVEFNDGSPTEEFRDYYEIVPTEAAAKIIFSTSFGIPGYKQTVYIPWHRVKTIVEDQEEIE